MNLRIVLYLCVILSVEVWSKRDRIVGGETAEIEEFPFTVSLRLISNNRHVCGGTIISRRHVLTAAHCIVDVLNVHNKFKVQAGSTYLSSNNATVFNILRAYIHPKFTGRITITSCFQHDIGVLLLQQFITFSDSIGKARLPTRDIVQGESAELCGWGALYYPAASISDQLQKAPMTTITHTDCTTYLKHFLHKEQFCGLESIGVGGCTGDSGGPLVVDKTIIGINSLIFPCALGLPDIYTKVYSYLDFIHSIMIIT